MATVRNTLSLQDKTSPVLNKIVRAMESTLAAMSRMDHVSDSAFQGAQKDIEFARKELEQFNNQIDGIPPGANRAANSLGGFKNPLVTISAGIYAIRSALQAVSGLTNWSDTFVLTKARLDLMNDGLQTTQQLQDMIMASAERSRGSYADMAQSVSKLGIMAGDAFKNNQEIVAFTELMTKSFKVGGAGIQEQKSAMYQLTQAMAAGKLQGDEFRSIMENAPMLAAAIAKYLGKTKGELKTMSAEGTITADIIKAAMFTAADDINGKYATLPKTFADVATLLQNKLTGAFQGVLAKLNTLINNISFDQFMANFVNMLATIAGAALYVFDFLVSIGSWLGKNWSTISPIVYGVVAAFIAFNIVALITNVLIGLSATASAFDGAMKMKEAGSTFIATAAQWGLNAALYAFPGTWIVAAVLAIIAAVVALGVWLYDLWKKNMDFKYGVLGIWEDVKYGLAGVFSVIQLMGVNLANGFEGVLSSVVSIVQDRINDVIGLINQVISASNALTGAKTALWKKATFGDTYKAQTQQYAADRTKAINDKIANDTQNHLNNEAALKAQKAAEILKNTAAKNKPAPTDKGFDFDKFKVGGGKLDSVGKIESDVSITDEDIKMLKDVAAVEFTNKYTTLRPEVNVSFGDVRETADVNKIMDALETMMAESYASALV